MMEDLGPWTRCFSCGHIHNLEMCPQRYLSPHTEEWNHQVGQEMLRLGWKEDLDNKQQHRIHLEAIRKLQERKNT